MTTQSIKNNATVLSKPLYDISKCFQDNLEMPFPACPPIPLLEHFTQSTSMGRFLDYPLMTPIGVAACAITTSRGITQLAQLGFGVFTYKTIRSHAHPAHPMPNIVYLDATHAALTSTEVGRFIKAQPSPPKATENINISNSLGNPCLDPESTQQDIAQAKQALNPGQVLIVSVYGESYANRNLFADFAYTAQLAEEAGADVIELNLSCPNLLDVSEPLYQNAEAAYTVTHQVVHAVQRPVIAKIGWLQHSKQIAILLNALARAGASGISAINSINMQVVNTVGQPVFTPRAYSGVSGNLIRPLAIDFMTQLADINQHDHLDLTLLGMGGVTQAQHFTEFHQAGSHIALSATGVMWNPYLALQYHNSRCEINL